MGRQDRCGGNCSEHKLELVPAVDHDALLTAADAARSRAARFAAVARDLAEADIEHDDPDGVLRRGRDHARRVLREAPAPPPEDVAAATAVTGWWCARCGNVDLPQPCIGVCVWQPAEWVSLALYERDVRWARPYLDAARVLGAVVTRVALVTPRAGQGRRNWEALSDQARVALAAYTSDAPSPEPRAEPEVLTERW
jgi:hypothetical protein